MNLLIGLALTADLFIEFPNGCNSFNGPHAPDCLAEIWNNTGCLIDGRKNPSVHSNQQVAFLQLLDLKLVGEIFFQIFHISSALLCLEISLAVIPISFSVWGKIDLF